MKNYLIADRYAAALDAATPENDALETVSAAMNTLAETYREQQEFRHVLANPALQLDKRSAVLAAVAEKAGAPESVQRLVGTLLRRGRIALLPDVALIFERRADARMNRVGADVTTAAPLGDAQRDALRTSLETFSGAKVSLHEAVDPAILGGAIAKVGSTLIDGSVRSRLRRLRAAVLADER